MSVQALKKWVLAKYPTVEEKSANRYLRAALKKGVAADLLKQTKGSFKLSTKGKDGGDETKSKKKSPKKKNADSPKKKKAAKDGEEKPKKARKPKAPKEKSESGPKKTIKKKAPRVVEAPVFPVLKKALSRTSSNSSKPLVNVPGAKYENIWQYKEGQNWKSYDEKASDVVEEVYQKYLANKGDTDVRAVKSGQWEYQVDFSAMKQTNIQHENHTTRDIRRIKNASS